MTTAIITNPVQAAHDESRHVERAARMRAIDAAMDRSGIRSELLILPARPATDAEVRAVHQPRLLETLRLSVAQERLWIDNDTYTTNESQEVAYYSAGSAITATEAVLDGRAQNAFAITRPPGHHATSSRSMGFCLLNNIAIAARYAIDHHGIQRVAIIDYDVHHGNGTQDIFYDDPTVLFCSSHASPLYPGTGAEQEIGSGAGLGTTLNIPLPYGAGDRAVASVYEQVVIPALRRFEPELILVSAGFDGHWNDPLGPLSLSVHGYATLTKQIMDLAAECCAGRLVLCLEGGYNEEALGASVVAALRVLLGQPPGDDPLGPSGSREPEVQGLIERLLRRHPLLRAE
jgi:acetoin utilization deacetylase AcuC-like enzyme